MRRGSEELSIKTRKERPVPVVVDIGGIHTRGESLRLDVAMRTAKLVRPSRPTTPSGQMNGTERLQELTIKHRNNAFLRHSDVGAVLRMMLDCCPAVLQAIPQRRCQSRKGWLELTPPLGPLWLLWQPAAAGVWRGTNPALTPWDPSWRTPAHTCWLSQAPKPPSTSILMQHQPSHHLNIGMAVHLAICWCDYGFFLGARHHDALWTQQSGRMDLVLSECLASPVQLPEMRLNRPGQTEAEAVNRRAASHPRTALHRVAPTW
jgi:hypothetical protein